MTQATSQQALPGQGTPDVPPAVQQGAGANGAAAAAVVSAGAGCFALGLLTTLAEASGALRNSLTFYEPVGPLSGKTTWAVLVWLVEWGVLHLVLRGRWVNFDMVFVVTLILVALGLLGTFPPFFYMV